MSSTTPIQRAIRNEGDDGLVILPYDDSHAIGSLAQQLHRQVEPTPDSATSDEEDAGPGGVIRRTNEFRSSLGPTMLESVALAGMELSKAIERRSRDLYRNQFPIIAPRFEKLCRDCGTEYDDEDVTECEVCGSDDLRTPDKQQRTDAHQFFKHVNKEGQSLQELYQSLDNDAGRLGGWVHLVRYNYGVLNGAVMQEPTELVRADPKRVKPVVDENGRIGGYWYACPIHREDYDREAGACEKCGADKREVFFAETEGVGRTQEVRAVYFEDEVIDYAAFNERLSGHDWLSPVEHLWKRQAILEWMNSYAAAFFDDKNTERYPGRLLILHTSNAKAVEKQLAEAQDEADQDPYANGVLYNEIPRDGNATGDQAQVIDLMNDELMGQAPDLKDDFKSDIRSVYGQVDVQDSELEDAGGLNNEGLQLSVRDDYLASEHQSLRDGPLQKLMRVLGFDDYEIRFVPVDQPDEPPAPSDVVNAAATAEQAGISYAVEDGVFRVADTDGVVDPEPSEASPDEGAAMFADDSDIDLDLARQSIRAALENLDPQEAGDGARWIENTHEELFGPFEPREGMETQSLEQQARAPVFHRDEDVPQFAERLIGDAIEGGAITPSQELSAAQNRQVESITRENLTQDAGWSISDLTSDIESGVGVDETKARQLAVNAAQDAVNAAIMLGYTIEGDLDDREFYLAGPHHPNICRACENVLFATNPKYVGAEPVTLDELREMMNREVDEHFESDMTPQGGKMHINCLHRVSEYREARDE